MKFTDNDKDGIRQRKIQQLATNDTALVNEKHSSRQSQIQRLFIKNTTLAAKNTAFINEYTFFSLPVRIFAETSNCFKCKEKNQKKGFTWI